MTFCITEESNFSSNTATHNMKCKIIESHRNPFEMKVLLSSPQRSVEEEEEDKRD